MCAGVLMMSLLNMVCVDHRMWNIKCVVFLCLILLEHCYINILHFMCSPVCDQTFPTHGWWSLWRKLLKNTVDLSFVWYSCKVWLQCSWYQQLWNLWIKLSTYYCNCIGVNCFVSCLYFSSLSLYFKWFDKLAFVVLNSRLTAGTNVENSAD